MARGISQTVAVGDPGTPANVIKPNADGSVNVVTGPGGGGATEATQLLVKADLDTLVTLGNSGAPVNVVGNTASGSALTDAPVYEGGLAATALPTAVANGQAVGAMRDKFGRAIVRESLRELQDSTVTTITSSTAATQIVAAGAAGVSRDIMSVTLNNSSATDTVVQLLDTDGTTVRWVGTAKANDVRGIVMNQPLKGSAAASAWKAKTVTSVASVDITVQWREDK